LKALRSPQRTQEPQREDCEFYEFPATLEVFRTKLREPAKLLNLVFAAYTWPMPGGTRLYHPKSPVTIAALVVLVFILIWVALSQIGWLR